MIDCKCPCLYDILTFFDISIKIKCISVSSVRINFTVSYENTEKHI